MKKGKLTFVLGGARSGKSTHALQLAGIDDPASKVLFVATAEAQDEDMAARIKAHIDERPGHWNTLEEPVNIAAGISRLLESGQTGQADQCDAEYVVVDCLTLWVSNMMFAEDNWDIAEASLNKEVAELLDVIDRFSVHLIIVSNEVGLGLIPMDSLSRRYRDMLGRVNQRVANAADRVLFMVAGIPMLVR